jgi:hypothetical protein
MLRRPKHSKIEVVAPKEEEDDAVCIAAFSQIRPYEDFCSNQVKASDWIADVMNESVNLLHE